jgi:hypothetical protein
MTPAPTTSFWLIGTSLVTPAPFTDTMDPSLPDQSSVSTETAISADPPVTVPWSSQVAMPEIRIDWVVTLNASASGHSSSDEKPSGLWYLANELDVGLPGYFLRILEVYQATSSPLDRRLELEVDTTLTAQERLFLLSTRVAGTAKFRTQGSWPHEGIPTTDSLVSVFSRYFRDFGTNTLRQFISGIVANIGNVTQVDVTLNGAIVGSKGDERDVTSDQTTVGNDSNDISPSENDQKATDRRWILSITVVACVMWAIVFALVVVGLFVLRHLRRQRQLMTQQSVGLRWADESWDMKPTSTPINARVTAGNHRDQSTPITIQIARRSGPGSNGDSTTGSNSCASDTPTRNSDVFHEIFSQDDNFDILSFAGGVTIHPLEEIMHSSNGEADEVGELSYSGIGAMKDSFLGDVVTPPRKLRGATGAGLSYNLRAFQVNSELSTKSSEQERGVASDGIMDEIVCDTNPSSDKSIPERGNKNSKRTKGNVDGSEREKCGESFVGGMERDESGSRCSFAGRRKVYGTSARQRNEPRAVASTEDIILGDSFTSPTLGCSNTDVGGAPSTRIRRGDEGPGGDNPSTTDDTKGASVLSRSLLSSCHEYGKESTEQERKDQAIEKQSDSGISGEGWPTERQIVGNAVAEGAEVENSTPTTDDGHSTAHQKNSGRHTDWKVRGRRIYHSVLAYRKRESSVDQGSMSRNSDTRHPGGLEEAEIDPHDSTTAALGNFEEGLGGGGSNQTQCVKVAHAPEDAAAAGATDSAALFSVTTGTEISCNLVGSCDKRAEESSHGTATESASENGNAAGDGDVTDEGNGQGSYSLDDANTRNPFASEERNKIESVLSLVTGGLKIWYPRN